MRIAIGGIVLVLACLAPATRADSPNPPPDATASSDGDSFQQKYQRAERERFDALRSDGSPRMQVLAGRLYLDSDDPANKLLPKREEVVARAVQLAPDDAFVQWLAADEGNYYSSQCGPTRWPEAEVSNLVRLEPDNAGAWQYAVALAAAKGNAAHVDDALAHMAAAKRADDHQGEEVQAWRKHFAQRPQTSMQYDDDDDGETDRANPQAQALSSALQEAAGHSSNVQADIEAVCKPDAKTDSAWQRIGWCVRAGQLLASQGNSFELRETGLKMLAVAGATPADLADPHRQLAWLSENAAMPMRNPRTYAEPDTLVEDWRDAPDAIVATEHRLKRLGQPPTPPAGWVAKADSDDAAAKATTKTWMTYLDSVIDDLRASTDVRERAIGFAANKSLDISSSEKDDGAAKAGSTPRASSSNAALTDLATANPDNPFVQWIAATKADRSEETIARLQRLEPDNAAAWALALKSPAESATALHHAASAARFDDHSAGPVKLLYTAFRRHPAPVELQAQWANDEEMQTDDPGKTYAFAGAMALAMTNMQVPSILKAFQTCKDASPAQDAAIASDCTKLARLILHSPTSLLAAMFASATLRKLDALDGADREYARRLAWWQTNGAAMGKDLGRYVDDYLATGSEIEALRLAMTRAGKAEPPANWQPPQWKAAAMSQ